VTAAAGWRVVRLHHVAFAHQEPGAADLLGNLLGLICGPQETADGFTERMLESGESSLQLLEATGPGLIERFVQRRGPGLHHVAFEVSDIAAAVADLRGRGVRMVDEVPRPGGRGTIIAFIHPQACAGLLVELVGTAPGDPGGRSGHEAEGSMS
jgi:methylmalonyl-CoA/ethylmalonyl-CoA epimerase